MTGWVCLHRQLQDHWIYQDADQLRAWISILMNVNHSACRVLIKGEVFHLKPGQSAKSKSTWAQVLGPTWSRYRVNRFFRLLEKHTMIAQQTARKTTILTVCNWDTYQNPRPYIAQTSHNDRPYIAHTSPTDNNENNEYLFSLSPREPRERRPDDEWSYVSAESWVRTLRANNCNVTRGNWPQWQALIGRCFRGDPQACAQQALAVPADERWPQQVEASLADARGLKRGFDYSDVKGTQL